jgi:hypothetical protein
MLSAPSLACRGNAEPARWFSNVEQQFSARFLMMHPLSIWAVLAWWTSSANPDAPIAALPVSVQATNEAVARVVEQLRQPGRVTLDALAMAAEHRLTLTVMQVPFWTALEQLGQAGQLRLEVREGGQRLALKPLLAGQRAQPSSISGPFRVVAESVQAKRFQDGSPALYTAELLCHWEPSVRGFLGDTQAKLTELTDDQGQKLPILPAAVVQQAVSDLTLRVSVPLGAVPRAANALTLTGHLDLLGTERIRTFTWDAGQTGVQTQAPMSVDVREVKRLGPVWSVTLVWTPGGPMADLESFQSGSIEPEVRFVHATLPALAGTSVERDEQGRSIRLRYTLPSATAAQLAGWRLEVRAPDQVRRLRVPFTLRNVRLP